MDVHPPQKGYETYETSVIRSIPNWANVDHRSFEGGHKVASLRNATPSRD